MGEEWDLDEARRMYEQGQTTYDIARQFGLSQSVVASRMKRAGLPMRRSGGRIRPRVHWSIEKTLELYSCGWTIRQLATHFGVSTGFILTHLRLSGVPLRSLNSSHQRYDLNELAFEPVDGVLTEAQQWMIGFLMADGCVHRKGPNSYLITLQVALQDREAIDTFRAVLGAGHPATILPPGEQTILSRKSQRSSHIRLAVSSPRLAASLAQYGIVPKKSLTASLSDSIRFLPAVWRGIVDGDGSLHCSERPNYRSIPHISIVGSEATINQWVEFIDHELNIRPATHLHNKSIYTAGVSCNYAIDLARILYGNSTIHLKRKHALAIQMIELPRFQQKHKRATYPTTRRKMDYSTISREQVISLYAEYHSWNQVAKHLGLTRPHMRRFRRLAGL